MRIRKCGKYLRAYSGAMILKGSLNLETGHIWGDSKAISALFAEAVVRGGYNKI